MPIAKKTIEEIASLLRIDVAKLMAASAATDEQEVEVGEFEVFTKSERETRDAAQKAEGKREGDSAGKAAGKELAVKDLKAAFGVEFDGKDMTKLVEVVKAQLAKGDDGLKQQVTMLQEKLTAKDADITALTARVTEAQRENQLIGLLPKNRLETISDGEYLTLIKAGLQFETTDGKTVVKRNGEILRDAKTTNPLSEQEAINSYMTERKWITEQPVPPGGRGGGNTPPGGKAMKVSQLAEQWTAEGKNPLSAEFQNEVSRLAKENPEFDLMS